MIRAWRRLKSNLRSSGRIVALVRGVKGFVRGPESIRSASTEPRFADRVIGIPAVALSASGATRQRINLLIPTVAEGRAFAGVMSAIDLFEAIAAGADRARIVSMKPLTGRPLSRLSGYEAGPAEGPDTGASRQLVGVAATDARLEVGSEDVFVATFWSTAYLARQILDWQDETFGPANRRFGYVIQDFEPGFYPWSAEWLVARATYDDAGRTVAFFNTSQLRDFFHGIGLRFATEHAFEPRLWPQLMAAAERGVDGAGRVRQRRIVVYGRPSTPRNAFPLLVDGLRAWAASHPRARDWTVVSAGEGHPDIELAPGLILHALGKLSLDDYAALLMTSSIGLSFMVSPHPSFPPLEMAHLGLRVLTNAFDGKDLAAWHENIESIEVSGSGQLGRAIARLCARLEEDPGLGERGRPLRDLASPNQSQFPFADEAARALGLRSPASA